MLAQNDPEGSPEDSKEPKEPPKPMSKLVRVMTVLAYLSSVSMAAILLSIYYLCIWKSPVLSDLDANVSHQQGESFDYRTGHINNDSAPYNFTGGSGTTVNDSNFRLPPSPISVADPDDQSSSDVDTITEQNTMFNTSMHYNTTTEVTTSANEASTVVKTTLL